jgi:hypothetical protein
MKRTLAVCLALSALAACDKRGDRDDNVSGTRSSADTVVTSREMQDTAVIRHDTTISTDTVHKRGTRPVDTDTVKH